MNNAEYQVEEQDLEYQRLAGKPWLVRLYQPRGAGPFPTIIDVHGGAWHNGDRLNNAGIDRELASRGISSLPSNFASRRKQDTPPRFAM